jgi:hypothetical protein
MLWRKLWFEVKGTRFTFFQRDDENCDFNRSVSKRGQIKMEEVLEVRQSTAKDAIENEIEIVCAQVWGCRLPSWYGSASAISVPLYLIRARGGPPRDATAHVPPPVPSRGVDEQVAARAERPVQKSAGAGV